MPKRTKPVQFMNPWEIFELSRYLDLQVFEVGNERHEVLIVDNFYKHPMKVKDFFLSIPALCQ